MRGLYDYWTRIRGDRLMPRYRLTIEYDGAPFTGWQSQAGGTSVQDVLERAVAIINGGHSMVYGAGRTDAGVHALAQVAHVDLVKAWDPFKLRNALNGNMREHPVSVLEAEAAGEGRRARSVTAGEDASDPPTRGVVVVRLEREGRLTGVHRPGEELQFGHGAPSCHATAGRPGGAPRVRER